MKKDVRIDVSVSIRGKLFKKTLTANFRDKTDIPAVLDYFDSGCFGDDDEMLAFLDIALTEICPSSDDAFKDVEVF